MFSKRNIKPTDSYIFTISESVRSRILQVFKQGFERLKQYGKLDGSPNHDVLSSTIQHVFLCSDDKFLDFTEYCFQVFGGPDQSEVNEINNVFREEGIGYELISIKIVDLENGKYRTKYPRIISKEDELLHQEAVKPCLAALSSQNFGVANEEFLKGMQDFRNGQHDDAITSYVASFESVLKTICKHNKWHFDEDKGGSAKTIEICINNNLIPVCYQQFLFSIGTVRNKLGDAHGKGPVKLHNADKVDATTLMHMVSTAINLLITRAGMN